MKIVIENVRDHAVALSIGGTEILTYEYQPDTDARSCPRPFVHPLRTLAGDVVTNLRPADHPWHVGLSMTLTSVDGINFWGGQTYSAEEGKYIQLPNVGAQVHRDWISQESDETTCTLVESLDWVGPNGERLLHETRTLTATDVKPELEMWRLIWDSALTNVSGRQLRHESYSSGQGLQGSGYTGLFLRMSRGFRRTPKNAFQGSLPPEWDDYHDGTAAIAEEEINGHPGSRLAYQGVFDTSLRGGLLILEDLTREPGYDHHWFHRPQLPALAFSTAFNSGMTIEPDQLVRFTHAIGLASGFWTKERMSTLWSAV